MLSRPASPVPSWFVALAGLLLSLNFSSVTNAGESIEKTSSSTEIPIRTQVFESKAFAIDQIYKSMEGPREITKVTIGEGGDEGLLWVLSYETKIVDTTTGAPVSDEYMCHNNFNLTNLNQHRKLIGASPIRGVPRMFALSQGVMGVEFPAGFGVPVRSGEPFVLNFQVLNLNPIDKSIEVRFRTTVRYALDSELKTRMKPLYQFGVQGMKLLAGSQGYPGVTDPDPKIHGESCSVGEVVDAGNLITQNDGQIYTNHWIVEPGREENHTLLTQRLGLKHDVMVHYIAIHVHPFAESLELRDLTTGETVYKARVVNFDDKIGLVSAEHFSSVEGLKLFKDHEYTLISIYQNNSEVRQDAMASMFLYLHDPAYEHARVSKR
ncbi:MAG TPA: hypothetical protein EYQ46_17880 [Myxococcales bacterium]|nr:hypothetical protein [Myxococcales bacterium]